MKLLLENWRKYLNEIGEAALRPYPFKAAILRGGETVLYEFNTEQEKYSVWIKYGAFVDEPKLAWEITFDTHDYLSGEETGEHKPLQVLSTIVAIIKDFIKNAGSALADPAPVLNFRFVGAYKGAPPEEEYRTSRTKLYKRFLERALKEYPGAKITEIGTNEIHFAVPRTSPQ
jgi:hypothetical protein